MKIPRPHRILIVPALLIAALLPEQAMACVSVSVDWWLDGDEVHATAFVEDYYDEGDCFDTAFGEWTYWTHDYSAGVNIESPSGRSASDSNSWDGVPYGGGFARASAFLSVANERGIYTITVNVAIYCSVAGAIGGSGSTGQVLVYALECTPSVTRGGTATATLDAPGASSQNWSFSGGGGTASKSGGISWSGVMAVGGRITVTFDMGQSSDIHRFCDIAVNDRSWSATPSEPHWITSNLRTPPRVAADLGWSGFAASPRSVSHTEIGGGPNDGFLYYASFGWASNTFQYRINTDLEDEESDFSEAQTGTNGIISWDNLNTQTHRHEHNHPTQSHWGVYAISLRQNDPMPYVESRVGPPGEAMFDTDTADDVNSLIARIKTDFEDDDNEPYAVNQSATGVFLGNINWID